MRKLVTVREVSELIPIEGADFIQIARVGGWACVVNKDHFKEVGEMGVYFEIDSFLPMDDNRYDFLASGTKKRTFNNKKGYVLKTKRFKGQLSQGLLLPLSMFPEIETPELGVDYSETLSVEKYEVETADGSAPALGSFPIFIHRTEQERIQNTYYEMSDEQREMQFVPTMKVDGTSTTMFIVSNPDYFKLESSTEYEIGLCSHNVHLDDPDNQSIYGKGVSNSGWYDAILKYHQETGRQVAIQGETVGNKIQKNRENFNTFKTFAFDVFDIDEQRYLTVEEFRDFIRLTGIECVPELSAPIKVLSNPLDDILKMSDGEGINCEQREGIVWKSVGTDRQFSFKAISNEWLMGKGK